MTTHRVKCRAEFFGEVLGEVKRFEVRRDDRGYEIGDVLHMIEIDDASEKPTGRHLRAVVLYVLRPTPHESYGLRDGHCCMSIDLFDDGEGQLP